MVEVVGSNKTSVPNLSTGLTQHHIPQDHSVDFR
jgi:hypothetical protein